MKEKNAKGAINMSNTSNSKALKGSKFWMQEIVNDDLLEARLEELLGEKNLHWATPLQVESYKEYQLKEPKIFSEVLGLSREAFKEKFSFWATNQPRWDAIAVSADGKILYLFEAKSHIKEMLSKISASNPNSIEKITNSMLKVFEEISNTDSENFAAWTNKYYQLGNRLTFLHFMNQMALPKICRTVLVLLNITDDETYISTPKEDWTRHYEEVFQEMLGKKFPPSNVKVIYFSGNQRIIGTA